MLLNSEKNNEASYSKALKETLTSLSYKSIKYYVDFVPPLKMGGFLCGNLEMGVV